MSVNLSSRQFQDSSLVEQVRRVLAETGLAPNALKLEITESVLMQDIERTAARMRALTDLGVSLAIDDFATGYSSLSYLQRLPVDTLKIDQSFVRAIRDEKNLAIVEAIASLAHALGLNVTAEGIETIEQALILRRLRCERGQGYHFARPLPPADFVALLDQGLSRLA